MRSVCCLIASLVVAGGAAQTPPVQPTTPKTMDPAQGKGTVTTGDLLKTYSKFRDQWEKSDDPAVFGRHLTKLGVDLKAYREQVKPPKAECGEPEPLSASPAKSSSEPKAAGEQVRPGDPDAVKKLEQRTSGTYLGVDYKQLAARREEERKLELYCAAEKAVRKLDEVWAAINKKEKEAARKHADELGEQLRKLDTLATKKDTVEVAPPPRAVR